MQIMFLIFQKRFFINPHHISALIRRYVTKLMYPNHVISSSVCSHQ